LKRASSALKSFRELILLLQEAAKDLSPAELIEMVLDKTGYLTSVEQQDKLEHTMRADNLRELANAMAEATEQGETLEDVLDRAALASDADAYDETITVSLMTLHSAKGLEFDAVFLVGLEEGVLPHGRSIDAPGGIEEERRLFYVGMTRAKESLVLSRAIYRRSYGEDRLRASLPSRFFGEIPAEMIETAPGSNSDAGDTRRYEDDPDASDGYGYRRQQSSYQRYPSKYGSSAPSQSSYRRSSSLAQPRPSSGAKKSLIGTRVRHSTYGVGTIIGVEGEGEDRKFTVSFQNHGPKKLLERYANLQFA